MSVTSRAPHNTLFTTHDAASSLKRLCLSSTGAQHPVMPIWKHDCEPINQSLYPKLRKLSALDAYNKLALMSA